MLKKIAVLLLIGVWSLGGVASEEPPTLNAVVKVFAVSSRPNYFLPWQNFPQSHSTASGFVIAGNRIVTNAHAVANPTFITVRKLGDQNPYPTRVAAVSHECDLAILTVDVPDFFNGIRPLELEDLPPLQSSVSVVGYPIGGDNLSITSGILSRIEPLRYAHSGKTLLGAQVDAAINPGNSGGPVLHNGKAVGIAFQGMGSSQNIGYLIPCSVLRHFLDDIGDGKLNGFPDVPFRFETMENPDLRRSRQMNSQQSGVLINSIPALLGKEVPFQEGDVLLKIADRVIANDGTIDFGSGRILFFGCLFWEKQLGAKLPVTILRDGKIIQLETIAVKYPYSVRPLEFDATPNYFLAGGIVFTPLTVNYLASWNNLRDVPSELAVHLGQPRESEDAEIVVVSMVLADEVNLGYQGFGAVIVDEIDAVKVRNLKHAAELIDAKKSGFLNILFRNRGRIVLDAAKMREATSRILQRYRIGADRNL